MSYYHLYSDGKTVKEIDINNYAKLERQKHKPPLISMIGPDYVILVKGNNIISTTKTQLKILVDEVNGGNKK